MPIPQCTITGNVQTLLGTVGSQCRIRISVTVPFFHTGSFISGELSTITCDDAGDFTVDVIETETVGKKINFIFDYYDGVANRRTKAYAVVIPNEASALLSDLIAVDAAAAGGTSIPASYVSVAAISGLSATDAQAALAELQGDITDIKSLATGALYIGDGSGIAQEVVPTGDVTISSAGVTAISSGVIVNADVNAAAAIARSKLAAGTAHGVVINDASGVLSSVAPSTTGNVLTSNGTSWVSSASIAGNPITVLDDGVSLTAALASVDFVGTGVTATVGGSNDVTVTIPTTTASNVGAGTGVFKQKTANDLEFKTLTAGSSKITLTSNTNDVGVDVAESALTLSNLGGTLSAAKGGTGQDLSAATGVVKVASGTVSAASLVNADVSASAAIDYSKLNLATSIVNADVSASAAIAYSKLNLATSIVNADVAAAAAIARTKIANGTASHVVINDGSGTLSSEATLAVTRGGTGLATLTTGNVILGAGTGTPTFVAPSTSGNVLTSNGTTWTSAAPTGSAIRSEIRLSGTPGTAAADVYGTTNTRICRFSTADKNVGSDITYSSSTTLGDSFTINSDGLYSMGIAWSAADNVDVFVGFSQDSAQLTTNIHEITATNRLCVGGGEFSTGDSKWHYASSNWTGFLASGTVVRPHGSGSTLKTATLSSMHIVKIGA